jgi:hypothetical protein
VRWNPCVARLFKIQQKAINPLQLFLKVLDVANCKGSMAWHGVVGRHVSVAFFPTLTVIDGEGELSQVQDF